MADTINVTAAGVVRDSAERRAFLQQLEELCGHNTMMMTEGHLRVRVPLAVYLAHVPDADLATLSREITRAAGIMIRAMARLGRLEFGVWSATNVPQELGPLDEIAAELGLVRDRVESALDDLLTQPADQPAPFVAGSGGVDSEPQQQLGRCILEKALLVAGVRVSGSLVVHVGEAPLIDPGSIAASSASANGNPRPGLTDGEVVE